MTDTTTTNISADYELTRQLVRSLTAFKNTIENDEGDTKFGIAYDQVQDLVTALSRVEVASTRAALARAAALIADLHLYFDDFTVAPKERDLAAERLQGRIMRLAWQSLFHLEDDIGATVEAEGFGELARGCEARELFPCLDRLNAVELAEAAE
jgi:hypothetical protein